MFESTRRCIGCKQLIDATFAHCQYCGAAQQKPQAHAIASGMQGIAIAGSSRDIHITQGNSWDTRPTSDHDRRGAKSISRAIEITSNVATIFGFLTTAGWVALAPSSEIKVFTAVALMAITALAALSAAPLLTARVNGWTVVRVGSLVLGIIREREDNHRLEWINPRIKCPECPAESARGVMTLQHLNNETWWVCAANRKRHRYIFDGTQYVDG